MSRRRQISNSLRVRASIPLAASITITAEFDRGERAVGVLGEVLVAGRVEQVEHAAGVLERHHRGHHGDAAVALDAHPVGARAAALALGADVAGKLDGAAGAQQVFRQGGLAGVGVGDDRERAAAGDLGGGVGHALFRASARPSLVMAGPVPASIGASWQWRRGEGPPGAVHLI